MIELQEPSDLMVVAEHVTPSGRRIPDSRIDMGLGEELSLSVYDYTPVSEEELRKRWMPLPREISHGVSEILGNSLTEKFAMYQMDGAARLPLSKKYAVAIVTDGQGAMNGMTVKRGDRLLLQNEGCIQTDGDSLSIIVCC